jgi:imidazolonepropionase-like amidohydrolase
MEIIVSMTKTAACLLGLEEELGTIEEGKKADLVLLAGNPLDNVENLDKVLFVFKEGQCVFSGS